MERFETENLRKQGSFKAPYFSLYWLNYSWICGFEHVTREFEFVTNGYKLVTRGLKLVDLNLHIWILAHAFKFLKCN